MKAHVVASSSFTIDDWEEQPILDEDGLRIYRTHFSKRFEGGLEARSVGDMIMTHLGGQPVAYCGFEHVSGTLAGRLGSFVLHHNAANGIEGGLSLTVVPGSGTGHLDGLQGAARIEVSGQVGDVTAAHVLVLDYQLG
jgi:hypothetical protein